MNLFYMHSNVSGISITGSTGFIGNSLLSTFNAVDFESMLFMNIKALLSFIWLQMVLSFYIFKFLFE
jgi:hypothetical protein